MSDRDTPRRRAGESEISAKSERMLIYIRQQLRDGFTGEIRLECMGGGIRGMDVTQKFDGKTLPGE